jgi:hypothetical protein
MESIMMVPLGYLVIAVVAGAAALEGANRVVVNNYSFVDSRKLTGLPNSKQARAAILPNVFYPPTP